MTDRMTAMSASTRASEVRLSGPTHLRMCIRVSTQAGPARSRCCGPARGPWAASGPEEAPRSSATRSGSFASSRRRMASHAHLGTTGRETSWAREVWGQRAASGRLSRGCGQEELRDSERTYASISRHRRPRRHRTRKRTVGPAWSVSGRRSCSTRSGSYASTHAAPCISAPPAARPAKGPRYLLSERLSRLEAGPVRSLQ